MPEVGDPISTGSGRGALAGLRVIDTATLYAGPFISTVLADHGADVIKIEPVGGDEYRLAANRMWPLLARHKKSVVADLRSPEGADLVRNLVAECDVLVVNMPASLLVRIGLDYETVSGLNADLIYVHVTGFGADGPYGDRPGNGSLAEAMSGLTHMTGAADGPPTLASVPLGDAITGYVGAFGVLAACYQRLTQGGGGQFIDVNPLDAMLQVVGPVLTSYVPGGDVPGRLGSGMPNNPLRGVFATRDGGWVVIGASTPRHVRETFALAGYDVSAPDADPSGAGLARLRAWLAEQDRDAVVATFMASRLPISPVADAADLHHDPHLAARRALVPIDTAEFGPIFTPAPTPRLHRSQPEHSDAHPTSTSTAGKYALRSRMGPGEVRPALARCPRAGHERGNIADVATGGGFGGIAIATQHRSLDRLMIAARPAAHRSGRAGRGPHHDHHLVPQAPEVGRQPGVARAITDRGMEGKIQGDVPFAITGRQRAIELVGQPPQLGALAVGHALGREPGGHPVQGLAQLEHLGECVVAGAEHDGAAAGPDLDQTGLFERVERLAHRCAAGTQRASEIGDAQPLPGDEVTVEDRRPQLLDDAVEQQLRLGQRTQVNSSSAV